MDVDTLRARSGWTLDWHRQVDSTNDLATVAAMGGAGPRYAVVADRQAAGRGREGRAFLSPPGGLYVSLLIDVPPEDVPAGTVALVALAGAEAIEALAPLTVEIKWPNDLLIGGRKVGGILLELAGPAGRVVAGIGINAADAPTGLPEGRREQITGVAGESGQALEPATLLLELLARIDRLQQQRAEPGGAEAIAAAWRARQALIGAQVACRCRGKELEGVLEDIALDRGLLIRDPAGPQWRQAEHVQDLRPLGRTI